MSAMSTSDWTEFTREWTADDLDALPEDGIRRELIDGRLEVSPTPRPEHQDLVYLLSYVLNEQRPSNLRVTQGVSVRLAEGTVLIPDVLAMTAEARRRNSPWIAAPDVVLVVEVVSPSTKSADRVTKPYQYAKAGIPHYWRIELEPELLVATAALDTEARVYRPTGDFTEFLKVELPWPISFDLDRIRPQNDD